MNKFLSLFILLGFLSGTPAFSQMVDDSIDDALRKQYNTKQIEQDLLPALPDTTDPFEDDAFSPSVMQTPVKTPQTLPQTQSTTINSYVKNNKSTTAILKKGKKFKVKLLTNVSDKTAPNSRLTFVSRFPETSRYVTIPSGTVFKGRVLDSHPPYLSGNGGLIVIKADKMIYNGASYDINAKITMADGKHIFFNNIKGKRKFMKNMWNSTAFGSRSLKKMWKTTCGCVNKGGINILAAPFTLAGGLAVYAANVAASPVLALFTKGGSISIPSGSMFVIKLEEDVYLN